MDTYSFGEWLKQRRQQLRLTQRELASVAYCSVAMIKKIEADERHPSLELAQLLASSLKVPEPDHVLFIEVARGDRPVDLLWQMRGESALTAVSFHTPVPLPRPATRFVGRADELAQVSARLANPDCHLLTLVGPGGIGKTRLALEAAQAQQAAFVEGTTFVSLAAIADTALIPDAVARSLRLTLAGPPAEQVLDFLRRRNMLLILDNCEQLDGDLTWLSDLLAHAPGVKLLATSRERLHLVEEWVFAVPELTEATALFVETARRVKQDFDPQAEQAAVVRICQLVENLPLAVELAAGWTPLMSSAQIADHIQQDINLLATDIHNVPERHRSAQAVFDHSWRLLAPAEQDALMRLSVLRGRWQAPEALAIAGADLRLLRRLVDKSLVRVGEHGRYELHELIRQFASRKLAESGFAEETRRRHFEAYLAVAEALDAAQFGPNGMAAVAGFDQEHDNFRAALDWSTNGEDANPTLRLLLHVWFYWSRRGYYQEARERGLSAIRQAGTQETTPLSVTLSLTAAACFLQGRYGEAESLARQALAMARRLEDPRALVAAYSTYTFTSVNAEQALDGLHEAIALVEATGQMPELLPLCYLGAATWLHSSGRYAEADDYYRKSVVLFRQIGAVDIIAEPLSRLGQLALQEGRLQEAHDLTVESIAAARAAGYDVTFGAWGASWLGLIQLYLGEVDAAERSVHDALQGFENGRDDARGKLEALAILSEIALARGDVAAAAGYLRSSLDIGRVLYRRLQATQKLEGAPDALPVDLNSLCSRAALVAAAQGQHERAVTLYAIAEAIGAQSGQSVLPSLRASLDQAIATVRSALADSDFQRAWNAGQAMSLSDAFAFLLA